MDNQNTPFQPQNDNSQPDPAQSQGVDQTPANHGPASSEEVEAARAAFQAAMKKEYANSPPAEQPPSTPQDSPATPTPAQDSVDSFQIPSMPQSETPQPQTQPPQPQPSEPSSPPPAQPEDSPHSIQNFPRRRHPGTEQTTRMPQGEDQSTPRTPDTAQTPPRSVAGGSGNKAPLQPLPETVIGEAPSPPQPQEATPTTSSETPGYVDNTAVFTQQQPHQPPAPSPDTAAPQPQAPTPLPEPASAPPQPQPSTEQAPPQPAQNDWHIKPAFSEGVIGVNQQNPPAPPSQPPAPAPNTAAPQPEPQPQTPTPSPEPASAPPQPPQPEPAPSPPQTSDQGSFQIPPVDQATSNPAPSPPVQSATPAPATTPEQAPTTPNAQAMPQTEQPPETQPEQTSTQSKGRISQYFQRLKSFNFKPFVSAGLMGMAVFAVFNSQVLLGQIQYITTPSGGVETTGVVNGESAVGNENKIIIPKINVDVPVVYDITTFDEDAVQEGLERGVVHYGTTALPGEIGNNVIVGHSSNNWWDSGQYKFAFILLDRLDDGDEIVLHYEGTRYVYEVTRSVVVEPTDVSVLEQGDDSIITLITCTPPGTSWQRLVIQAEQVTPGPSDNVERGTDREVPDELPSDLPRDNTGGFMEFMRGLF